MFRGFHRVDGRVGVGPFVTRSQVYVVGERGEKRSRIETLDPHHVDFGSEHHSERGQIDPPEEPSTSVNPPCVCSEPFTKWAT